MQSDRIWLSDNSKEMELLQPSLVAHSYMHTAAAYSNIDAAIPMQSGKNAASLPQSLLQNRNSTLKHKKRILKLRLLRGKRTPPKTRKIIKNLSSQPWRSRSNAIWKQVAKSAPRNSESVSTCTIYWKGVRATFKSAEFDLHDMPWITWHILHVKIQLAWLYIRWIEGAGDMACVVNMTYIVTLST